MDFKLQPHLLRVFGVTPMHSEHQAMEFNAILCISRMGWGNLPLFISKELGSARKADSWKLSNTTMWLNEKRASLTPKLASCGIRAHDLPLTKRVLCQLS